MILSKLSSMASAILGSLGGAAVTIVVGGLWVSFVHDPRVRLLAQMESQAQFRKLTGELTNEADKRRLELVLCRQRGGVFDFQTGRCGET